MHSWEHFIRDDNDYRRHIEYCYINPVKHGYVTRSAIGRIRHFTATFKLVYSPRIGPVA